jgi:hypothetical protein
MAVELQKETQEWLESVLGEKGLQVGDFLTGQKMGQLLAKLLALAQQPPAASLKALKPGNTPAVRLYNWNILGEVANQLGVRVEAGVKSRIVAGNAQEVGVLLAALHVQCGQGLVSSPSKSTSKSKAATSNSAHQATVGHARACFELTLEQANTLLGDRGKMLAHLLIKGFKGSFDRV